MNYSAIHCLAQNSIASAIDFNIDLLRAILCAFVLSIRAAMFVSGFSLDIYIASANNIAS